MEQIFEKKEFVELTMIRETLIIIKWKDSKDIQNPNMRKQSFDIVTKKLREIIEEMEEWGIYPDEFSFNVMLK